MFLNLIPSAIKSAITQTGAISADWVLVTIVGAVGALLAILISILIGSINSIKIDVKAIHKELHDFIAKQNGFNEKIEERTKGL